MRLFFTADSKFILKNQKAGVKLNKGFIMLKKIKRFLGIGEYSPYVKSFLNYLMHVQVFFFPVL